MSDSPIPLPLARPTGDLALGWPHVLVRAPRDRRLARMVVGAFGLVLGASTGLFVGGMIGVLLAMLALVLVPELAIGVLVMTTLSATSLGAVVGSRMLARETFED